MRTFQNIVCQHCGSYGQMYLDNLDSLHLECLTCGNQQPINEQVKIPVGMRVSTPPMVSSSFNVHYGMRAGKSIKYQDE